MNEFGEKLRQERESRGIALVTITEATKIGSRYLTALENGQFDVLPGGVINKGIVRNYARVVGLKEEVWVSRFVEAYRQSGKVTDQDANWMAFAENVGKARPKSESARRGMGVKLAGVTVLVLILVALGWLAWHFTGSKATAQLHVPQAATASARIKAIQIKTGATTHLTAVCESCSSSGSNPR